MQFAMLVDFAPMAILRSAFRYVGGLDEGMSEPGMCGICKRGGGCSEVIDVWWQLMIAQLFKLCSSTSVAYPSRFVRTYGHETLIPDSCDHPSDSDFEFSIRLWAAGWQV